MSVLSMLEQELAGKRVLIRQDLNVPMSDGVIANDARLVASLPTIKAAVAANAKVMVMSHLGRPVEGEFNAEYSLEPIAQALSQHLGMPVRFASQWLDGLDVADGEVVVCENVRFNQGEKSNDEQLSKQMASLCDVFVMDAFGTAHRAQASTHGVAKYAPVACAGPLLVAELDALAKALDNPARPVVAIVGGSKVSTKLTVLDALTKHVDQLIVGGGIANTFIAAAGHNVGKSLCENDLIDEAKRLIAEALANGGQIPIPSDVVCGSEFSPETQALPRKVSDVAETEMIFDIGPNTATELAKILDKAGTIVWNGPVGVFEFEQFSAGTKAIAQAVAQSSAFSIAGGGDTVAAIEAFGVQDQISYISTGGGAFLEFLEGKKLPAVEILEQRAIA